MYYYISDYVARTTRSFYREIYFIGCFILVTQTTSNLINRIIVRPKKEECIIILLRLCYLEVMGNYYI